MNKRIGSDIELSFISIDDSQFTFPIINSQRVYLGEWLPWVKYVKIEEQVKEFYQLCEARKIEGDGFECLIKFSGVPVGQIGLHKIDKANKSTSIGYWLSAKYQGKGIITQSCKAIVNHCFEELNLNRIEIRCAVENYKSNNIPVRLLFRKEGILKQAELLNDRFVDLNLYALTKSDWDSLRKSVYLEYDRDWVKS